MCCNTWDGDDGINVCLECFDGACNGHVARHQHKKPSHRVYLSLKRTELPNAAQSTDERPQKLTKIGIGVDGGAPLEEKKYKMSYCDCGIDIDIQDNDIAMIFPLVDAVMFVPSSSQQDQLSLQKKECPHAKVLVQEHKTLSDQQSATCDMCDHRDNLWLCLTCGHLGCGRRNFDGSGGNAHAMHHGHHVVVKLGTISPEGTGDVYCYSCDDAVLDKDLSMHLKTFGIDASSAVKTEKTMAELLDFNSSYEEGKKLVPVSGPGKTGINNLGNSCYMASVLQSVFSLPSVTSWYKGMYEPALVQSMYPADDPLVQLTRVCHGLCSGTFSGFVKSDDEKDKGRQIGISPRMLKSIIAKDAPVFASHGQQDAAEFLDALLSMMKRVEGHNGPSHSTEFVIEERLMCSVCHGSRRRRNVYATLSYPIPYHSETNTNNPPRSTIFQCLDNLFKKDETVDNFNCPICKTSTKAARTLGFVTYPSTLVLVGRRFVAPNWVPIKVMTPVSAPGDELLNLVDYSTPVKLNDEQPFPDDDDKSTATADPILVTQLMEALGVPRDVCTSAVLATSGNGTKPTTLEDAAEWILTHPNGSGDAGDITQLLELGFDSERARAAMKASNNNVEAAVEMLFSNTVPSASSASVSTSNPSAGQSTPGKGYKLADDTWVLFNDNKVAQVQTVKAEQAYILFYERVN